MNAFKLIEGSNKIWTQDQSQVRERHTHIHTRSPVVPNFVPCRLAVHLGELLDSAGGSRLVAAVVSVEMGGAGNGRCCQCLIPEL